jgi:hypothetical protein
VTDAQSQAIQQKWQECADAVATAMAPVVKAFAEFGRAMTQVVNERLAAKGLTWEQVEHLPPDELAAILWGDEPDKPIEVQS